MCACSIAGQHNSCWHTWNWRIREGYSKTYRISSKRVGFHLYDRRIECWWYAERQGKYNFFSVWTHLIYKHATFEKKINSRSFQDFSSNKHYVRSPESAHFYKFNRYHRKQIICFCQNQLSWQLTQTPLTCYPITYIYI